MGRSDPSKYELRIEFDRLPYPLVFWKGYSCEDTVRGMVQKFIKSHNVFGMLGKVYNEFDRFGITDDEILNYVELDEYNGRIISKDTCIIYYQLFAGVPLFGTVTYYDGKWELK